MAIWTQFVVRNHNTYPPPLLSRQLPLSPLPTHYTWRWMWDIVYVSPTVIIQVHIYQVRIIWISSSRPQIFSICLFGPIFTQIRMITLWSTANLICKILASWVDWMRKYRVFKKIHDSKTPQKIVFFLL